MSFLMERRSRPPAEPYRSPYKVDTPIAVYFEGPFLLMTDTDSSIRLAAFLSHPVAASLVLAGLSVTPSDHEESCFAIGKPKSTSGNSITDYEIWVAACRDHGKWGGICFDAPVLDLRITSESFVVEHLVLYVGGTRKLMDNPGSFRESFHTLSDAIDFIFRFYFRDSKLFKRLTVGLTQARSG